MRPKYQTRASRAEEQVFAMLKSEKNIQRPWSLVAFKLESRTLQTTAAEASILFNSHANLRPGYEVSENTVFVPNLFIKLSGSDDAFKPFENGEGLKKREGCFVYESFKDFCTDTERHLAYESFLENGILNKEAMLASPTFHYTFLRREYQEVFIDKVNEIVKNKNDYFVGQGSSLSDAEIISCLLQMNEVFLQAFHYFDFQFQPPAVIIYNEGKEKPSIRQALNLILLNLLGFDIIVLSREGHSDIENLLNPEVYSVFIGEKILEKPKAQNGLKPLIVAGAAVAVIILSLGLVKAVLSKNSVLLSQKDLNTASPTQASSTNTETGLKAAASQEPLPEPKPYNPPEVVDHEPVKMKNKGETITFSDPALEKSIRSILGKETGEIFVQELSSLGVLRFIGPYAGGKDWHFITGYSPFGYYDTSNMEHNEEGDIKHIAELGQIPDIQMIEVSWQQEIDLNSIKGSNISRLSLKHDYIEDISPLATLKSLRDLDLGYNNITDLSPLASLPLSSLSLQHNVITDISPLTNMKNLTYLDLCGNPVKDLTPLVNHENLRQLYLLDVHVDDARIFEKMTRLESLNLERSGIKEISALKHLTYLNFLVLCGNDITDISALKDMKRLQHLDISMTLVQDISVLKELPSLRTVGMHGLKLDAEAEAVLKELKHVNIWR